MFDSIAVPPSQQNWKPIPGFEDYEISDYGTVRRLTDAKSTKAGAYLTPNRDKYGYLRIRLWDARKSGVVQTQVHRLVAKAFIGEIPEGQEVNHKDGNKSNNHVSNLEYVTHQENIAHSFRELNRTETVPRGENAHHAKLTTPQVIEIREKCATGKTRRALAAEYNVSHVAITAIVNRKTWKHVS